eukprot:216285-Chlamydomonas_euryale.AAC.1
MAHGAWRMGCGLAHGTLKRTAAHEGAWQRMAATVNGVWSALHGLSCRLAHGGAWGTRRRMRAHRGARQCMGRTVAHVSAWRRMGAHG